MRLTLDADTIVIDRLLYHHILRSMDRLFLIYLRQYGTPWASEFLISETSPSRSFRHRMSQASEETLEWSVTIIEVAAHALHFLIPAPVLKILYSLGDRTVHYLQVRRMQRDIHPSQARWIAEEPGWKDPSSLLEQRKKTQTSQDSRYAIAAHTMQAFHALKFRDVFRFSVNRIAQRERLAHIAALQFEEIVRHKSKHHKIRLTSKKEQDLFDLSLGFWKIPILGSVESAFEPSEK